MAHKEERAAYEAKYYAAHRENIAIWGVKYRSKYPTYASDWYYANREKKRVTASKWEAKNRQKCREYDKKKRARKKQVSICDLTDRQWEELKRLSRGYCEYYMKPSKELTQDHVIPLTRGGNHTVDNIAPVCRSCNSEKKAKTLQEWFDHVTGGW